MWEKLAVGGETTVTVGGGTGLNYRIVVYEVSGITKGTLARDVVMDDSEGAPSLTSMVLGQSPVIGDSAGDTSYANEFACQGVAVNGNGGSLVSITGGFVSDVSPGPNGLYASSQIYSSLTALFATTTTTWTTAKTLDSGIIATFRASDYDPVRAPDWLTRRRVRPKQLKRYNYVPRIPGGTPQVHDLRILRQRRRLPKRSPRREFTRPVPEQFPTVPVVVRARTKRTSKPRRGLFIVTIPSQPSVVAPTYPYELLHTRRARTGRQRRGQLFVYPITTSTPPSNDPIVIEPIRGFLVTDGKTSGILITDGHTTGVLLSDGKTTTVLLT